MKIGVVGAGVFGLAAAIGLRSRGHAVTVFDKGAPPYENASSTDVSKSIRRTWYSGDNDTYVELVERAAHRWRDWERRSGDSFYHETGGLGVLDSLEPGDPMHASVEYLRGRGAEIEVLSPEEAGARFPQFDFRSGEVCVYDGWAGYLESGRAVSVMARLAEEGGVDLRECAPVEGVGETGAGAEEVRPRRVPRLVARPRRRGLVRLSDAQGGLRQGGEGRTRRHRGPRRGPQRHPGV